MFAFWRKKMEDKRLAKEECDSNDGLLTGILVGSLLSHSEPPVVSPETVHGDGGGFGGGGASGSWGSGGDDTSTSSCCDGGCTD